MANPGPIHSLSPDDWLLSELDRVTPEWSLAALSEDADEQEWRSGLRQALRGALGLDRAQPVDREVKLLDRSACDGVTVERILYNSEPGVTVPALLLIPHVEELPQPAVVLCYGPGAGKSSALTGPSAVEDGPDQPLARRLLNEGLIVIVPDLVCAGERQGTQRAQVAVGNWLGRPLLGRWVHDALCTVDVLNERQEIEASRLGVIGIGPGGGAALHAMALDERLRVGVVSGQLARYADRLRLLRGEDWRDLAQQLYAMVPGVLRAAELEDIAGLCAPRPLLMSYTPEDAGCTADGARDCAERVREGYARLGGKGLFQTAFLPDMESRFSEATREFLTDHLRAQYV